MSRDEIFRCPELPRYTIYINYTMTKRILTNKKFRLSSKYNTTISLKNK